MVKKLRIKESLTPSLELYLEDFAQEYGEITYADIMQLSNCWDSISKVEQREIKKLVSEIRKACKETGMDSYELAQEYPEDKDNCEKLVNTIQTIISRCKTESCKNLHENNIANQIYSFLDDEGGYTDYNQKIEDVATEFGLNHDEAEGYVWSWASGLCD